MIEERHRLRGPIFRTMSEAASRVAAILEDFRTVSAGAVLGVVRGGVPIAAEVARQLAWPLDLLIDDDGDENDFMVATVAGALVADSTAVIKDSTRFASLLNKTKLYRGRHPPRLLRDQTVVITDDGIHTGTTLVRLIHAVRERRPSRVVVAVAVSSVEGGARVKHAADEFRTVAWREPFGRVGMWYQNFVMPSAVTIRHLLDESDRSCRTASVTEGSR